MPLAFRKAVAIAATVFLVSLGGAIAFLSTLAVLTVIVGGPELLMSALSQEEMGSGPRWIVFASFALTLPAAKLGARLSERLIRRCSLLSDKEIHDWNQKYKS
jgi:hypothetical protein